jgi:hypothetical protein
MRPEVAPEVLQELLDKLLQSELGQFGICLEIARTIWRRHREMVESPAFPEHLLAAYVAEWGNDPDDDCLISGEPYITEEVIAEQRIEALRWAAQRAAAGRAS